jgi:hypothetical protein
VYILVVYCILLLLFPRSEWNETIENIFLFLPFICAGLLILLYTFLFCGVQCPIEEIHRICNEMTSQNLEFGVSFHLETIESTNGEGTRHVYISHIEVRLTSSTLTQYPYCAVIKILPGNRRKEPYHMDHVFPPLLTDHMRVVTYERFCDRLDYLLSRLPTYFWTYCYGWMLLNIKPYAIYVHYA